MADKEERIFIRKGTAIELCKFIYRDGCAGEMHCCSCAISIPRSEAIDKMAKANWITVVCLKNKCTPKSVSQKEWDAEWIKLSKQYKKVYFAGAEAALNALLEDKK